MSGPGPNKMNKQSRQDSSVGSSQFLHHVAIGKPKKMAIVACMHKQLTILNTMMKNWPKFLTG
jgi:hypothetical protein